ncbi:MAG: hypothetical protein K6G75_10255 [Lachnospiraceae bacterium]|nr:hypothetical protein [Lachnospiraceae bacterium]
MACFLVPGTEAIVTTIIEKAVKAKEKKQIEKSENESSDLQKHGIGFSTKLGWLNKMLWGGSALLAFEHIWHGEVIPTFPFLTAVKEGETLGMLKEMGTAGVGMAIIVTTVWVGMVIVSNALEKRTAGNAEEKTEA